MVTNYYTLAHLANEWRARLNGVALAQPFTQTRNELVLPFESVLPEDKDSWVAVVNCTPSQNSLFLKDTYPRARRNSTDIFPGIEGSLVSDVEIHPTDRQIRIVLRTGSSIILQFFGPKANALLVGPDQRIADAFLRSKLMSTGAPLDWPGAPPAVLDESGLQARLSSARNDTVLQALKRALPSFGPVLLRETLTRAHVDGSERIGTSEEAALLRVVREALAVHHLLIGPARPRIYYQGEAPSVFAVIPLVHLSENRFDDAPSVNEGIRSYLASVHRRSDRAGLLDRLRDDLTAAAEQAATTLRRIEEEASDASEADQAERHAKLLQANVSTLRKGMREAVVEDLFSEDHPVVSIPLDAHLTPARNAERLFERARKIRTAILEQRERRQTLGNRVRELTSILEELENLSGETDLAELIERHAAILRAAGIRTGASASSPPENRPPFRMFTVDGGFQVWAGKSGENNDLLSTRHTAKHDLWFHVRGMSGSHVVLKMGTGRGEVSKRAKEQAAAIAAYYSKMKKARHVPVVMCEGKYVRKPKGAPAGTVTVERETVLFVDPALPEGSDGATSE